MADDMDDIEDLLEAPYKNGGGGGISSSGGTTNNYQSVPSRSEDDENVDNTSGDHQATSPQRNSLKISNNFTDDGGGGGSGSEQGTSKRSPSSKEPDVEEEARDGSEPRKSDKDKVDKDKSSSDSKKADHESSRSKSSKKSRKGRSRSRSGSEHRHKKRSRSRSRSKSKKSKRSRSRDRKRKSSRSRSRDRKRSKSRSGSRSRRRRSRSHSRDSKNRRNNRSGGGGGGGSGRRTRSRSPKKAKSPELTPEERDQRTVFCMQLSARIRPRDLDEFFSAIGKVRDVRLITDPRTKRSKGIAYIEFRDVQSVPLAIALSGQRLLGVPIIVKLTQAEKNRLPYPPPYHIPANMPTNGPMKLYVGSLHVDITEDMLRGIFAPFGTIDVINLARDEMGRSKGFGYIQFANAEDAKRAIEQLNNFELANKPIKVAPFTEKTNYEGNSVSSLDNDELDRAGLNLGASGKLALIAKLAEGSGIKLPQSALDALNVANSGVGGIAGSTNPANVPSQCFVLSNMFDLEEEMKRPNWKQELQEDVMEECLKYGGIVHINIDDRTREGNIHIKCPTIAVAMNAVNGLNGRYFAGKQISATYIPLATYHQSFPEAIACTQILRASS